MPQLGQYDYAESRPGSVYVNTARNSAEAPIPNISGPQFHNPGFIGPTMAEGLAGQGIAGPYTDVQRGVNPVVPPVPNATGQYQMGMGGGGGGYGGVGGSYAPTPVMLNEGDWLTQDDLYQALVNRLMRNENDFKANMDRQNALIDANAVEQHQRLGKAQEQSGGDLLSQAAARGSLLGNTGYGQLVDQMNTDYANRNTQVDTGATNSHNALTEALQSLLTSKQDQLDQGRADSLARRLAKYGI